MEKPPVGSVLFSAAQRCAQIIDGKGLCQKGVSYVAGKILLAKDYARFGIEVVLERAVAACPDDKARGSIVAEGLCRYRARRVVQKSHTSSLRTAIRRLLAFRRRPIDSFAPAHSPASQA